MRPVILATSFALAAAAAQAGAWAWATNRHFVPAGLAAPERILPQAFGTWREVPTAVPPVDPFDTGGDKAAAETYDRVVTHTYRRVDGAEVMLTLAYGRVQEQESKIHRPELCYFAQGYAVSRFAALRVGELPAVSFLATSPERSETVAYWIRVGDRISASAWQTRAALLRLGLMHVVPDGILVRASILSQMTPDPARLANDRATLVEFLESAASAPPPARRWVLIGGPDALAAAR